MGQNSSCLKLRPIERVDLPKLREWRNDPVIYKWCRQYEPQSEHGHETWFTRLQQDSTTKMYAIHEETSGCIGVCGLTSIDWINRRAEFSLYISPMQHGSGYGSKALRLLLAHAFKVLNLNLVWGESFDGNPAMKMFEKIGFKTEGRRREFYYREGQYIDAILFSITRGEYAA